MISSRVVSPGTLDVQSGDGTRELLRLTAVL